MTSPHTNASGRQPWPGAPPVRGRPGRGEPDPASDCLHSLTLRFNSVETEQAWRTHDDQASLGRIRMTLGLATGLYALFAWLDVALVPEVASVIGCIRIGVCGVILAVLLASWHPQFGRWRSALLAVTVLSAGGGVIAMLDLAGRVESLYYVGLILVVMATHAFRWLPFPQGLVVSLVVVIAYTIQLYSRTELEPAVLLNNQFFFLSALVLGAVGSYSGERGARMSFLHALRAHAEKARHEWLLENMLPRPVAQRLKDAPGPIAERFDHVSVIFIDMVGFSAHSAGMDPETLVAELDALFRDLDEIAHRYGVEKIKTMGDAYMAVAGLPLPCPDHAERVANMALAVQEHVRRRAGGAGLPRQLRIGIASGPAVAGVIGTSKLTYDLWGETVTLASRMQMHGLPDRIQVTGDVQRRLQRTHRFESRGLVDVKGWGPTPTWWLVGQNAAAATAQPAHEPDPVHVKSPRAPASYGLGLRPVRNHVAMGPLPLTSISPRGSKSYWSPKAA